MIFFRSEEKRKVKRTNARTIKAHQQACNDPKVGHGQGNGQEKIESLW